MQEFEPGSLIGHYKLIRQLGQGGMGIVYEAIDQKLGRHVALKFLLDSIRHDPTSLQRFWQEARTASALNHPGICTIYELNDTAEYPFIVMELLDGESLDHLYFRSDTQALDLPGLVQLGIQTADALDAAHAKGILHRDIKPANIFLTATGQAKLLDFGLAKLEVADQVSRKGNIDTPTAINSLTEVGISVGTVAYMSPEQARGETLDARSDIFSLGVVLYEGATGQHPFAGTTNALTFDRILNHAPMLPPPPAVDMPKELLTVLDKTLEKDRELRCQSAAELRADLKRLQRNSGAVPSAGSAAPVAAYSDQTTPRRGSARYVLTLLILVLIITGFTAWYFWPKTWPFAEHTVAQITNTGTIEKIALSADGHFLAEVKNDKGQRTVWIRNIATNTDTQILTSFANAYVGITFTPDGDYLYLTRGTPQDNGLRALYVMPVFGGTPRQILRDIDSAVSFSPDGSRFTYVKWTPDRKDQFSEVHVARKDGGHDEVVCITAGPVQPPVWSPNGKRIAWLGAIGTTSRDALQWIDLSQGKVHTVIAPQQIAYPNTLEDKATLAWLPDNRHLVATYFKQHSDRAQIGVIALSSGELKPITNDVNAYSELALSADGKTLVTVLTSVNSTLDTFKAEGGAALSSIPLKITPTTITWAAEDKFLFAVRGSSIGTLDARSGDIQNFDLGSVTAGGFVAACPNGRVLFTGLANGEGDSRLFRSKSDGSEITQLTATGIARNPSCAPDNRDALYSIRVGSQASLWSVPLDGGSPKQVLPADNYYAAIISRDHSLAAVVLNQNAEVRAKLTDLVKHREEKALPIDQSVFSVYYHFTNDDKAFVYAVARNGGNTLLYQPVDGGASHTFLDPVADTLLDFSWSPSGDRLAVMRLRSTSDAVLITDQKK